MLVLYRYTELLKVIETAYHRHAMAIAPYFNAIMQFHSQRLLKIIGIAKVKKKTSNFSPTSIFVFQLETNNVE